VPDTDVTTATIDMEAGEINRLFRMGCGSYTRPMGQSAADSWPDAYVTGPIKGLWRVHRGADALSQVDPEEVTVTCPWGHLGDTILARHEDTQAYAIISNITLRRAAVGLFTWTIGLVRSPQ
jgi:hypothetical protein